jgi:4'-phosphopantetheinyl transferase
MSHQSEPRCKLYLVEAPLTVDPAQLALLSDAERQTCTRLLNETHRARYTCAHALLRLVLADRLQIAAQKIEIQPGLNRRPELGRRHAAQAPGLDFNLSGTPGHVACAVGHDVRVGVDLEFPRPEHVIAELLERVLTHRERRWYADADDPRAFYQLWTLKEALAKADGEGLGLPFNQIETLPLGNGALDLDLSWPGRAPCRWRLLSLDAGVPAALALAGPDTSGTIALNAGVPVGFQAVDVRVMAEGQAG